MKTDEYKKVLNKMTKKEIEEFILYKLITDVSLRESFEINFTRYFSKKTKEDYKFLLKSALSNVVNGYYISEDDGNKALNVLYEYESKVEELIENNDIEEAIIITQATLETIGEFIIDGSYGEHEIIQNDFKKLIEKLLKKCSKKEKEKFIKWLKDYINVEDQFIDYKDEFKKIIKY